MSSSFIVLEGADGSGKTTQVELLKDYLVNRGKEVVAVREPGSTKLGEKLRDLLLEVKKEESLSHHTQVALFIAARAHLVEKVIRPALEKYKIVISDRWLPSTIVYQCGMVENGPSIVEVINISNILTQRLQPTKTIILNVDPAEATRRRQPRDKQDCYEEKEETFHQLIQQRYRSILDLLPNQVMVDGNGSKEEVFSRILNEIITLI